jgi:hypothetical protein
MTRKRAIEKKLAEKDDADYVHFELEDYVDNPVARRCPFLS